MSSNNLIFRIFFLFSSSDYYLFLSLLFSFFDFSGFLTCLISWVFHPILQKWTWGKVFWVYGDVSPHFDNQEWWTLFQDARFLRRVERTTIKRIFWKGSAVFFRGGSRSAVFFRGRSRSAVFFRGRKLRSSACL